MDWTMQLGRWNFKANNKSRKFSAAPESKKESIEACMVWESPQLCITGKCKPHTLWEIHICPSGLPCSLRSCVFSLKSWTLEAKMARCTTVETFPLSQMPLSFLLRHTGLPSFIGSSFIGWWRDLQGCLRCRRWQGWSVWGALGALFSMPLSLTPQSPVAN